VRALVLGAPATTDAVLLQRVARGELDALGALYDRYAEDLLRYATRLSGSGDAEDLVQNVFLRVLSIAATFDERTVNARPWLFGITTRMAMERRRSLHRFAMVLLNVGGLADRAAVSPSFEAASDIPRALQRLAVSKRVVLLLAELEGFSCPEIAAMLEVPVGTVWTRLHHARRELRAFFQGESS
jgi:RNA polymerase sigma factor (sigma-70 family)